MRDLAKELPDINQLIVLEPEELAAKLLVVLRRCLEQPNQRHINLHNSLNEVIGKDAPYPIDRAEEVKIAISEAWLCHWSILLLPAHQHRRRLRAPAHLLGRMPGGLP